MKIEEIIKANKEYKEWKDNQEKLKDAMLSELKKINNSLNYEKLEALSYSEIKEFEKALCYEVFNSKLHSIVNKVKIREYPILKKAHYYPVINEIDFLTDEQKNRLDERMFLDKNSYIHREGHFAEKSYDDIKFSKDYWKKCLDFLESKGVIERYYVLRCDNCDETNIISQSEISKMRRFTELSQIVYDDNTSEEKYEKIIDEFEQLEGYSYYGFGCECNYKEYENAEQIIRDSNGIIYKVVTKADTTYANL